MQQTEKYKLNLIEPSDPFLPEGLNANTQKMEDVMAAHEALVDGRVDGLDQRVTVLEGHKFAYGVYYGTGMDQTLIVDLGFKPCAVLICELAISHELSLIVENTAHPASNGLSLAENGFKATIYANNGAHFYIAFG